MDGEREQLLQVVERLAMVMAETGLPRMAARVYAYVLAEDADRYTARELSEGLGVSLAAISGAVKYLTRIGMIGRERQPGARADSYTIDDDNLWAGVLGSEVGLIEQWEAAVAHAADVLGDSRGGRRLKESQLFFTFLKEDLAEMAQRWDAYRDARGQTSASSDTGPSTQSAT